MVFIVILLFHCFLSFCQANLHEAIDTYVVETDYGNVRGYSKLVLGKKLYIFSGIPYACPPTGQQRFRKPAPAEPWNGVLDGTKLPTLVCKRNMSSFLAFLVRRCGTQTLPFLKTVSTLTFGCQRRFFSPLSYPLYLFGFMEVRITFFG